jgi:ribosomal protein S12 methylthiotransferase accessory factor
MDGEPLPRPRSQGATAVLDTAVLDAGPWADSCRAVAELLTGSLAAHGIVGCAVEVAPLGVRDELAVGASDRPRGTEDEQLPVLLYGHQCLLGPFHGAAAAGRVRRCERCLARRWQAVRPAALRDALELGSSTTATGPLPYAIPFASDAMAALTAAHREGAARAAAGTAEADYPVVYLLDLRTLRSSRWPLVPDAVCPECDRRVEDTAPGAEIALGPAPKPAPERFRAREAEDFGLRTEVFVNPVCGVLGSQVNPDLVSRSTAATVGSFTLRSGSYLRESFWGGHTDSYAASVRVGILEGLERFSGMRPRGKRTALFAALDDLDVQAVDPRVCGLYSEAFYQRFPAVKRFRSDRPIPWVWGYSLRDRRPVLVPEILTYYHAPGGVENRFVQESSNGCAAGGSLAEAAYFGLMEVVERDAFLIAWYGRAALPEIDPTIGADTRTRALVDRLGMYGYRARFFDARISFPIPVVVAVAQRVGPGTGALCFGAGASLDPQAALAAGLREIATDAVNLPWRTGLAEEKLRAMAADFDQVEVLHDHPLLYGLPEMARHAAFLLDDPPGGPGPRITLSALREQTAAAGLAPAHDLREDVERCVAVLAGGGFDTVVVDQTMPEQRDIGAFTASVIVPGLVPIDFGQSRQRALNLTRTRTALRAAGRLAHDLEPEELNQAPHPFP